MLSPYIHAALARERYQEFLARAETDRRARQARLHRLRDGAGAAGRSPRRWRPALSPAELRYFTDVDHHDHEALGVLDHPGGRGVGIARYVRDADDRQAAEIAVTIVDDWQGRGLGTELVAPLCQ
jgi:RimJ/RimL family protein N-acetyltransferase